MTFDRVRSIEPGHSGVTGFSSAFFTASALRASGTMANTYLALRRAGTVSVIARFGTSSILSKWPSFTCCMRHRSSSVTMWMRSRVAKSAGGSLKAKCPFSPIPKTQMSAGNLRSRSLYRLSSDWVSETSPFIG